MNGIRSAIGLLMALAAAAASAQSSGPAPRDTGTTHICGDIGLDEQQRMKDAARGHDLMLTFATTTGAYLADVAVQIRDRRGATVVDVNCDGPIMLVDLPGPGNYRITARSGEVARSQAVTVAKGKRPARATFVWAAESR